MHTANFARARNIARVTPTHPAVNEAKLGRVVLVTVLQTRLLVSTWDKPQRRASRSVGALLILMAEVSDVIS